MNLLFLSLSNLDSISNNGLFSDLLREFTKNGHNVYILSPVNQIEKNEKRIIQEKSVKIVKVKTGYIRKTNVLKKGINTILIEPRFKKAVKKYFKDVRFDLILYPTPPITFTNAIKYTQKRDCAKSYLMLKDIFPQNAIDIGMLSKSGLKGIIYKYFRRKEKKLYAASDHIGCMSQANVDYLLKHNPEIPSEKVEICPNSIEVRDFGLTNVEKFEMRRKYKLPCDKMIFVYGGNLGKPQGIPFLMDCLSAEKDNPNVFFLIAGDGTEYSKLETFVNESIFSNVRLLKRLPKEDYDRLVAACDVGMIFLDHRFTIPNFPSRLLSYMQAKLPVLACTDTNTDVGKVIVDGGFGWWCESNNVNAFCKKVQGVLSEDVSEKGQIGFEYLRQHYNVQNSYQTIMKNMKDGAEGKK